MKIFLIVVGVIVVLYIAAKLDCLDDAVECLCDCIGDMCD